MFQKIIDLRNEENKFARLLGMETTDLGEDYAKGRVKIEDDFTNTTSSVHGGFIYTLADFIAGSAAFSRGKRSVTLNSDFQYLKAARDTEYLYAEASPVKSGRTVSVYNLDITDDRGKLVAKGTFACFHMDEDLF